MLRAQALKTRALLLLVLPLCTGFGALLAQTERAVPGKGRDWQPNEEDYGSKDRLSWRFADGIVPDAKTALEIGTVILKRHIKPSEYQAHSPYRVVKLRGYWVVYGQQKKPEKNDEFAEGTITLEIEPQAGTILRIGRDLGLHGPDPAPPLTPPSGGGSEPLR